MGQITVNFRVVKLGDRKDRPAQGRQDDSLDDKVNAPTKPPVGMLHDGVTYQLPTATTPVNDPDEGFLLRFAWWSIVGDATFDQATFTAPNTAQPWVHVGNTGIITNANQGRLTVGTSGSDITATAWYIEDDGSVSGLLIDAFNADIGEFSNARFVTVTPDDHAQSRTDTANNLGTVDTKVLTVLEAYDELSRVVPFLEWTYTAHGVSARGLPPAEASHFLEAKPQSSGVAFALYQTPPQTTVPNVIGRNLKDATKALTDNDLRVGTTATKVVLVDDNPFVPPVFGAPPPNKEGDLDKDPPSDFGPAGEALVTHQSPQAGTVVLKSSAVNLVLTRERHEKPLADGAAT